MVMRFIPDIQGPVRALFVILLLLGGTATQSTAQQLGVPQSGVLTLSSERLFAGSEFGQRILREIDAESALLAEENERIVAELSKEEKELTERRSTLTAEEFRPLAEAFDDKVQSHREGQRAKLDALARRSENSRKLFFEMVQPVLVDLLRETGASVILEQSNVLFRAESSDITNMAIRRINAMIGDGRRLDNKASE